MTEEGNPGEPCTIPAGIRRFPKRTLFPNSDIVISIPSSRSTVGFLAGWAVVASIIAFVYFYAAN